MVEVKRRRNGSGKLYRSDSNRKSGKYRRQFIRTVKRTGKWRGKKALITDAR